MERVTQCASMRQEKTPTQQAPNGCGAERNTRTVHEMARDEARHGKAFAGLLKRYFGE